ncbi:hypothetical protein NK983_35660, partial [Salmonella enterica subsp. enterica serovar Typhimurium]|nr:hypothetical protein [Salmonella enterica subsp. enterica serovar Typhimurium]
LGVEEGNSIQMENAILNMYGAVHSSTVTSFKLNKVSTPWYESSITDVNRPLDPSSMEKVIDPGPVNGSNPNVSINI